MTPLELLESERDKWIKALRKSKESFEKNEITLEVHTVHVNNLEPLIKEWSKAVAILKMGM
jgi:hypothetical protein